MGEGRLVLFYIQVNELDQKYSCLESVTEQRGFEVEEQIYFLYKSIALC